MVCREIVALQVFLMVSGLSEPVVESSFARPRNVWSGPVEHHPILLVDMKPLIDHVCDESTGLRDSEDVGILRISMPIDRQRRRVTFVVLGLIVKERNRISHRCQREPDDSGMLGSV